MPGYWMIRSTVTNKDAFTDYAAIANPVLTKHGGRFISFGSRHETREGTDIPRNVIVEFPTYEDAVACYDDPDYQASLVHGQRAMTRELVIVDSDRPI